VRAYEYRHVVAFEETNVVGNVYYVNHLRWQGRCRELFLHEYFPALPVELANGLSVVTTRCSCEYFGELVAFDEVAIRMQLGGLAQNRISMMFEYWSCHDGRETLVARGEQQVAWMRRDGNRLVPAPVPEALRRVLEDWNA
jgi:enediyne biosynthesis thioesterase